MENILLYRRQFILSRNTIDELNLWQREDLNQYHLYVHPDLQVTRVSDATKTLVLLGYLFDPQNYQASNNDIMQKVLAETSDFNGLVFALKPYTGRYVLLYNDAKCFNILQDALALREVYYCQHENTVVCGSQPNLLERFAQPGLIKSTDPDILDFVQNHLPHVRNGRLWPGDGTAYDGVKHLLPNYYLDINELKSYRYWPNAIIERLELNDAIEKCAFYLQGALKAAAHRYKLMMAVTAGFDSRGLLAASKEISKSIYYFINKHDKMDLNGNDIKIPQVLFRQIGQPFHIHTYQREVPADYKNIFFTNTLYAHEHLLPVIYNVYHKQHSEKLNILGVGEVGRTKFFDPPNNLDAYYLAYMLKYRKSAYAVKECAKWYTEAQPVASHYKLNIMTLFWWEVLIGNWGAVGNSESDIAIEEFDPYNSHYLYETFLSVDPQYRTFNDNILFKELIHFMWPQLLNVPVNPAENYKDRLLWQLRKTSVEKKLRHYKFKIYRLLYQNLWSKPKHGN